MTLCPVVADPSSWAPFPVWPPVPLTLALLLLLVMENGHSWHRIPNTTFPSDTKYKLLASLTVLVPIPAAKAAHGSVGHEPNAGPNRGNPRSQEGENFSLPGPTP